MIGELAAYQEQLIELERLGLDVEGRLHTLQIKDSAGLVMQEKNCQAELQRKQQMLDREQEAGKGLRAQLKNSERELRKARDSFDKLLKRLQPELARRGAALPFSLSELQVEIDAISRCNDPEALTLPSPQPTLAQCDEHLHKIIEKKKPFSNKACANTRSASLPIDRRKNTSRNGGSWRLRLLDSRRSSRCSRTT